MIPEYKKPLDIYRKLLREARRAWLSKDNTEASDHFFNFCVTCISLRDWVIKYLNMNNIQKTKYQTEWKAIGYFGVCAEIANSSKHFGLEFGKASSVKDISAYTERMVAIGPGGAIVPGIQSEKPFFKITIDNDNEIDLLMILFSSCMDWENQFKKLSIADEELPELCEVFMEFA